MEKKALNRKLDALIKKNEKSRTAKKTADLSLEQANKKVRRLEADARLLNKKFRRAEAENSDRKSEETRLIVINKSLKKAVDKHQKEAHCLLFLMNRKEGSVSSTEKKIKIDFRALKVKFEKAMKEMKKLEKANKTLKTKNEVLTSDVTLKKAEIDLKRSLLRWTLQISRLIVKSSTTRPRSVLMSKKRN